jgi:hypothetical protein
MQDDLYKVSICSSEVHWSTRAGIFKPLRNPGIDSKESIPPAYVVWWVRARIFNVYRAQESIPRNEFRQPM